jgi:hypothetical protein
MKILTAILLVLLPAQQVPLDVLTLRDSADLNCDETLFRGDRLRIQNANARRRALRQTNFGKQHPLVKSLRRPEVTS